MGMLSALASQGNSQRVFLAIYGADIFVCNQPRLRVPVVIIVVAAEIRSIIPLFYVSGLTVSTMPYSVGRGVLFSYCAIIILNVVILTLSARVNHFQDYYYVADLVPLALSAVTSGIAVLAFLLDVGFHNSPTARPLFEIAVLFILSIVWLACNAFSTSRWKHVPFNCSTIPDDYSDVRSWCRDLQTLKAFVWANWFVLLVAALVALRFSVVQYQRGQKHIWRTPLSRFKPRVTHKRSETFGSKIEDFLRFSR